MNKGCWKVNRSLNPEGIIPYHDDGTIASTRLAYVVARLACYLNYYLS